MSDKNNMDKRKLKEDMVRVSPYRLSEICSQTLRFHGFSEPHVESITETLVAAELDGCHSHGIYRLIGLIESLAKGGVDPVADPILQDVSPGAVRVDARGGFSPLSFKKGAPVLKEKVLNNGVAVMAINHCVHGTALWYEVEQLTSFGLATIACNPTQSYVAPYGGSKPLLGTNPIAFGWPRKNLPPFVFDFATSVVARGDIELHRLDGKSIPESWGVDAKGMPTTSPEIVLEEGAMLAFGGHKGSALSMMIELLAGPLIGDLLSLESTEHDSGRGCLPYHGELIVAFDPNLLSGEESGSRDSRAERLFSSIECQGGRLPSSRRYKQREKNKKEGIVIEGSLFTKIKSLTG
jgi:LDH2 family malate/lactate/ureidoglycolate dehydrogenase